MVKHYYPPAHIRLAAVNGNIVENDPTARRQFWAGLRRRLGKEAILGALDRTADRLSGIAGTPEKIDEMEAEIGYYHPKSVLRGGKPFGHDLIKDSFINRKESEDGKNGYTLDFIFISEGRVYGLGCINAIGEDKSEYLKEVFVNELPYGQNRIKDGVPNQSSHEIGRVEASDLNDQDDLCKIIRVTPQINVGVYGDGFVRVTDRSHASFTVLDRITFSNVMNASDNVHQILSDIDNHPHYWMPPEARHGL